MIDSGGGSGWVRQLLADLGQTPGHYVVLDLRPVVNYFREHPLSGVEYRYLDDPATGHGRAVDVLYANSCLQYMPDNTELIDQIM